MRTVFYFIVSALFGLVMGIVLGYSLSWAAVVVFIFASGPENHEHSFGLLRWIVFGVVAGAVVGLIIGPITAYKCKAERDRK